MAASMTIDQAGLPAGVAGESRTDGKRDGALVTLTSVTVGTTYKFQFLWVALLDSTAVGSLAETIAGSPIWTFSPDTNRPGSYRIELIVDEGLPTESRTIRTFGVRTESGLLIPAFNERADPDASLILNTSVEVEASENNETSQLSLVNYAGWFDFYQEVARIRHIKQGFNEQAGTSVTIISAWYLKAGTLLANSRMYLGADTGIHGVRARLREANNPGPVLAEWSVTAVLGDVPEDSAVDITLPADGWYTLEILSDNVAAQAILQGAELIVKYDRP